MVIVFAIKAMKEKTVRIVKVVMKAAINMENVLKENAFVDLDGQEEIVKINNALIVVLVTEFAKTGDVFVKQVGKVQIVQ
jgi:hypothetical protein